MSEDIGYGFLTVGTEEVVRHSRVGASAENVIHDGGAVNIGNGTEGIVCEEFLHQMGLSTPDCKQKVLEDCPTLTKGGRISPTGPANP